MKKSGKMSSAQKSTLSQRMAERRAALTAPSATTGKKAPFFRPLPPEALGDLPFLKLDQGRADSE